MGIEAKIRRYVRLAGAAERCEETVGFPAGLRSRSLARANARVSANVSARRAHRVEPKVVPFTEPIMFVCAYCGAGIGDPCVTKAGKIAKATHGVRGESE